MGIQQARKWPYLYCLSQHDKNHTYSHVIPYMMGIYSHIDLNNTIHTIITNVGQMYNIYNLTVSLKFKVNSERETKYLNLETTF